MLKIFGICFLTKKELDKGDAKLLELTTALDNALKTVDRIDRKYRAACEEITELKVIEQRYYKLTDRDSKGRFVK